MQLSRVLFSLALLLAPVAFVGTTWLYLYPLFDNACAFPSPPNGTAPFRLLALGDPQLEGDSSLPKAGAKVFRSFDGLVSNVQDAPTILEKWEFVRDAVRGIPKDLLKALEGYVRKPIDIRGNDLYLAHIVRTLRWWTTPSHVAVLGDLLGSQWIRDEEFERRRKRYWDVVFRGMEKVPERVMKGVETPGREGREAAEEEEGSEQKEEQAENKKWGGTVEILGGDKEWANRVINIAGNHDIGYAGDIDASRIARFERAFGSVNWDIVFTLPNATLPEPNEEQTSQHELPALRLVILNTMNLDTPAYDGDLQHETYEYINHVITTSRPVTDKTHATILLTHIPLHKEPGVCVDSPFFNFFEHSGVKEQNMLSEQASKIVLESMFGLSSNQWADGKGFGRRGIIVNGHDHAGCDVLHWTTQPGVESACPDKIDESEIHLPPALANASLLAEEPLEDAIVTNETLTETSSESESPPENQEPKWQAQRYPHLPYKATESGECIALNEVPHIREVTLRSIMGEFSGYAGFLAAWFDPSLGEKGEWKIEVSTCGLGVQHWWWAVHVVDFVLVLALVLGMVAVVTEGEATSESRRRSGKGVGLVDGDGKSNGEARVGGAGDGVGSRQRGAEKIP
ncbi:hypothetical protein BU23DRAFT_560007 [Bimuria novae-zelandiae CBS 107.79]|uniref:Calcineurin-like phosphoesterase domain-containing protein n=1 Tax=Bimuria novae-zelandiae CBS 107.79 TaxID=1447943 RepID=A0A6A5UPW6_9PLEO|nr:hypothetical protein BU23DRAFT_560007 [Bimuria novae-zelandiae CBS 107.79]